MDKYEQNKINTLSKYLHIPTNQISIQENGMFLNTPNDFYFVGTFDELKIVTDSIFEDIIQDVNYNVDYNGDYNEDHEKFYSLLSKFNKEDLLKLVDSEDLEMHDITIYNIDSDFIVGGLIHNAITFNFDLFYNLLNKYYSDYSWATGNPAIKINNLYIMLCGNNNKFITQKSIEDFIYKIDDSSKLKLQSDYNIDEFFITDITNPIFINILSIDTKEPIAKIERSEKGYRFIVELTTDKGEEYVIRSFINTQDDLINLISQTVDALRSYPQFSKYADDLEDAIK